MRRLTPHLHWTTLGIEWHWYSAECLCLYCNYERRVKCALQLRNRCASRRGHLIQWRLLILWQYLRSQALPCIHFQSPALLRAHRQGGDHRCGAQFMIQEAIIKKEGTLLIFLPVMLPFCLICVDNTQVRLMYNAFTII